MKQKVSATQRVLNIWAIILFVWSLYRINFRTDLPIWIDEFIAKPLVFILPVYFYITQVEKKNFLTAIQLKGEDLGKNILLGLGIGSLFFLSGLLGIGLKNNGSLAASFSILFSPAIIYILLLSLATAVSEEILSRGFVLQRLYEDSKNMFSAAFLSSILFFILHIPILFTNDKIIGVLLLQVMVTDLILSFGISLIFLYRKNLVVPIIIHALYSLSLYLFSVH